MLTTRIDKQFINSQREIIHSVNGDRDRHLVLRLVGLVSLAFQYPILQEDIFGNKILTSQDVARVFGLNRNYLNSKHPDPEQLRDKSPTEIREIIISDSLAGKLQAKGVASWYTNLDNALYQLFYTSIPYNQSHIRKPQVGTTETVSTLREMKVFSTLQKVYANKTRTTYYEYKESEQFIINNARYFLYMDFLLFSKLTLTELRVFMDLLKVRGNERYILETQQKKSLQTVPGEKLPNVFFSEVTHTTSDINYLAAKWGLEKEDGKEGKTKFSLEYRAINNVIKGINEKAGYTFCDIEWVKARPTDRFKGQPILRFPYPEKEKEIMQREAKKRKDEFCIYFLRQQFRKYNQNNILSPEDFKKKFINYLHDSRVDPEGKREAGFKALQIITNSNEYVPDANFHNYVSNYIGQISAEKTLISPQELGL